MNLFHGTGVAVVTPFLSDRSLDLTALRRLTNHLISGGIEYLVVLGTTGEVATLNEDEQKLVIETVLEENQGRVPVVIGVGGNDTRKICKTASAYSEQFDIQGLLSVSPYYNKPSQEGIYQHYKAFAQATDLPIILYNVPPRTASNMSATTSLRLAHDFANIVAIKEASGDLEQCMHILREMPDGFTLLSGDDALTIPLISLGAAGVISVTANAFPRMFSDMTRAALSGDFEQARHLFYRLMPLINLNFAEGNPAGVKCELACQEICQDQVRLPLVAASDELKENIASAIQKLPLAQT
jgi:4-hydroxy-tetrahydrodipicolinate synthase